MDEKVKSPIIISGVPRSRTSLVTGLFHICGLQLGNTCGITPNNRKGQFENREIIDKIEKTHLSNIGADTMGQWSLPDTLNIPQDKDRRGRTLHIMNKHNVNTAKHWGFKDAKAVLTFPCWLDAFPNSIWVIIHRKKIDIAKSCERTSFMKKRKDWSNYVDEYRERLDLLKGRHDKVYEINSDELVAYNLDKFEYIIKKLDLNWEPEKVEEFIDPKETHI